MATTRPRDGVWILALARTARGETVTHHEIAEDADVSSKTAREVLTVASENGLLIKEMKGRKVRYRLGDALKP